MKKLGKVALGIVGAFVLIVIVLIVFVGLSKNSSSNKSDDQVYYKNGKYYLKHPESVGGSESTVQKNWKKGIIKNADGRFKITKIAFVEGSGRKQLLFVGNFKNTSKKPKMAFDFMSTYTDISTVYKDTKLDVYPAPNTKVTGYETLLENGGRKLLHNESTDCALVFSPIDHEFSNVFGKSAKFSITNKNNDKLLTVKLKPDIEHVAEDN